MAGPGCDGGLDLLTNGKFFKAGRHMILLVIAAFIIGAHFSVAGAGLPAETAKDIVIIHTYHQGFSMTDIYDEILSEAFLRAEFDTPVNLYREYLDVERIEYNDGYDGLADSFRDKYSELGIDGILCVGKDAYEFVSGHYDSHFSDIPAVHMGVDEEMTLITGGDTIDGISQVIPFEGLFAELLKLTPELDKIDIYTNSKAVESRYTNKLEALSDAYGVLYQIHSDNRANVYIEDILSKKVSDGVILLSYLYDEDGTIYTLDYIVDRIDLLGAVPVMVIEDYYVGKGAVGSVQYDQKAYVMASVEMLLSKVTGEDVDSMEQHIATVSVFDYAKIKQLGLNDNGFETSDVLLNRPSVTDIIQQNSLEFIILALIIITVILVFSVTNLLLRLKAEKDREDARKDLQLSYMELEAAHEQLVASESELTRQFRELQMKEDELRKSRERYRLAAKGSEFGIWDFDMETGKMYFSNKGKEILGFPMHQESFGMEEFYGLFDVKQELQFRRAVDEHLSRRSAAIEYEALLQIGGNEEWISVRGRALFDSEDKATRLAGSLTNITQEKASGEKLLRIAFMDELTGLHNKAYLNSHLEEICGSGDCDSAALILVDLDHFKTINDSLGHSYGDEVLRKIAEIIQSEVGTDHDIVRFGGDEFIIIIKDYEDAGIIDEIAINLIMTFRNRFDIDGIGFSNTLSMGIATYPADSESLDELLQHADLALNEAKARGRNQYVYYDVSLEAAMKHSLWYEREIKLAIEESQFELYYQPKYHIDTDKIIGYEALIRWHHPEKGLISPAEFIPIAEENGLIIRIGEWVVGEAIRQLDQWHRAGYDYLTMSINLSAKQFKEIKLEEVVSRAMSGKRIKTRHIEFEITETTALHDIENAVSILSGFREQGYKIALDDFGTGYSSLNYLNVLPIDTLKIDKTFIAGSMVDRTGGQIIKTVIALAHAHDMEVVAEGVETSEQLEFLRSESCDVIQGYYISKPVEASEAIGLTERSLELI